MSDFDQNLVCNRTKSLFWDLRNSVSVWSSIYWIELTFCESFVHFLPQEAPFPSFYRRENLTAITQLHVLGQRFVVILLQKQEDAVK